MTVINCNAELALTQIDAADPLYNDILEIKNTGERAANLTRQLLAFSRKQLVKPQIININGVLSNIDKMLRRISVKILSL